MTGAELILMFASGFLAATILPIASEAVLASFSSSASTGDLAVLIAVATVGNVLGALLNWWIGGWLTHWQEKRWFPIKARSLERASKVFNRWGQPSLLLAWTPFLGDPLTFVAGLLRVPIVPFLIYVTIGKVVRYVLVAGLASEWL
ncbi:YqaA family protein [Marivibrio halodurans]